MRTIVTAGHVDHGKSTLVAALTGMQPDRTITEQERGLTVDLGFTWMRGGDGLDGGTLAFVDVPGHARFVRNMIAGVGGVFGCLFVVSAAEGWKPQSEEHLRILEIAGVEAGVIALTRSASLGRTEMAAMRREIGAATAGTFLAGATVVATDAPEGKGLEALRQALWHIAGSAPAPADTGRPRLFIDRCFVVRGSGAVVTGILAGGVLRSGSPVHLAMPGREPEEVRIRRIETLGTPRELALPGERVACNLGSLKHRPGRGAVILGRGTYWLSDTFDGSISVLPRLGHDLSRRGAFTVHVGSGEYPARIAFLAGAKSIAPGCTGTTRIRLDVRLPLSAGDRFVLRESGRQETVGGGTILDVSPVLPVSRARPDGTVGSLLAERGYVEAEDLWRQTGERVAPDAGPYVFDKEALTARTTSLRVRLEAAGGRGIDVSALDDLERLLLAHLPGVTVAYGVARDTASATGELPWLAEITARPFSPPPPFGLSRPQLRELVQGGRVVQVGDIHFSSEAVVIARERLAALIGPSGVTLAEFRDDLGTSRRYALALLEHFDSDGTTRRRGEQRVPGPRLGIPTTSKG